jgi:uncharacterized protein (DUF1778 family)
MEEARKKRGGSDTARENKMTGVVAHFTRDERRRVGMAAASTGQTVKEYVRQAALEKSKKVLDGT